MGIISESDIQKVREASDLIAIVGERCQLRQRGRDFWCCCPFHDERTPSCKLDPSTQLWHCFGCGEGGDVFGFIMKSEDMSFPEAVRYLADRAHIEIVEEGGGQRVSGGQKSRLKQVCAQTAEFYHLRLMRDPSSEAAAARDYLKGRELGGSVPKSWQLGFAPGHGALVRHLRGAGFTNQEMLQVNVAVERNGALADRFYNRIMFPIFDVQGDCIAFGGRVVGKGEPKYLNSQETPLFHKSQVLYALDKAKASMASTGTAIVVEGYTDVIALHEAGIKNAVATLGTALTAQHIRQLSRHAQKRIVYLFDGDEAGQRAADRALQFIGAAVKRDTQVMGIELYAVTLPDDLDPAEFVAARGADELRALVGKAKPLIQYGIDRRLEGVESKGIAERAEAFTSAMAVLAPIKDTVEARSYAREIGQRTGTREDVVDATLRSLKAPRLPQQEEQPNPQGQERAVTVPAASAASRLSTTQAEKDRDNHERELLSIAAQHPDLALSHADALAQTKWHDATNARIAELMLDVLSEKPDASAAHIVSSVALTVPQAAGILTEPLSERARDPETYVAYLVERLSIDDAQEELDALRRRLANKGDLSEEDEDLLYKIAGGMQQDIARRREALSS